MSDNLWFNNVTNTYESTSPTTDEIARQYIPQNDAAQNLYDLYRRMGMPILKAIANVLHLSIGEKAPFKVGEQS